MADPLHPIRQWTLDEAKRLRAGKEPTKLDPALLRAKLRTAMGSQPDRDEPLDVVPRGQLKRDGYTIELAVIRTRPGVYATTTLYRPEIPQGEKRPAVLVVHGHWKFARRDPTVQSRCLGLVKQGFIVLTLDAFGAGERHPKPAPGVYHGGNDGGTLWPIGATLLGMQVYDNRRMVDYLLARPDVNGKIGITGASGGGNQSMYAGAMDERIGCVVPVCSVGNYRAYLHTACCVCEVLPGALTFTDVGEVLSLVAPRPMMVISAAKDSIQFSPAEAAPSVAWATQMYQFAGVPEKFSHLIIDSGHDYNKPMREAMYGFMTLHLKGQGKGEPIVEPELKIESPDDLRCYPDLNDRPNDFLFAPSFAAAEMDRLNAKHRKQLPDHREKAEAQAELLRTRLKERLALPQKPIPGIIIPNVVEGKRLAISVDMTDPMTTASYTVITLELTGTGKSQPPRDAGGGAKDHNTTQHCLTIGQPLLGRWVQDVLDVLERQPSAEIVFASGPACIPLMIAVGLMPSRKIKLGLIDCPATYRSVTRYADTTPMAILTPGIVQDGDIPHLLGLVAPRELTIRSARTLDGKILTLDETKTAFADTTAIYAAWKAKAALQIGVP